MLQLPPRIGRYTLVRLLGRGGQGEVWEAVHHGPGGIARRVALKVVRGEAPWDEARLGGLLRHPNLVDVYEVGEVDDVGFLAMELCLDGTLGGRGPLPPRAVVEVGLQ
ncbi:MAG: serine/threonine protein kinase, partial [Myxococcales bacterium]|nr:serine/threonine protein kinase [Myxococcales bacterium]